MSDSLRLYLDLLDSYQYNDDANRGICKEIFRNALNMTAHIARATNVAWAAGVCTYAARMMTTIGVRSFLIREGVPGKGVDEHKVLALAALDMVSSWSGGRGFNVDESISTSLELLRGVVDESRIKGSLPRVKSMLNHLAWLLPRVVEICLIR